MKKCLKISFVIIGSLVGAGFASGREILSFFFIYGIMGIIGIFISIFLIGFVIYKVFEICLNYKIESYSDFCTVLENFRNIGKHKESVIKKNKLYEKNVLSELLNNMVNIFLLITFYIMIAGFSSFLNQELNLNKIISSLLIVVLCSLVFLKNINGLIKISDVLIPFLIMFILLISAKNLNFIDNFKSTFYYNEIKSFEGALTSVIKAVLYASYNTIILIPMLIPLSKKIENKSGKIFIPIFTGIILILLCFAVYNLLLQGDLTIYNLEMPIIGIVKKYGNLYKNIYSIIIIISIFTTAISSGYGFLNNCSNNKNYKRNLVIMCITAIFLSQISFATFVNLLYPVLGIFGLLEIFALFSLKTCKKTKKLV